MMTARERLRRCYFHEELDRPGIFCRTGFPPGDSSYDKLRELLAEKTELKFGGSARSVVEPVPTTATEEAYSDDFSRRITRLQTPKGELVSNSFKQ